MADCSCLRTGCCSPTSLSVSCRFRRRLPFRFVVAVVVLAASVTTAHSPAPLMMYNEVIVIRIVIFTAGDRGSGCEAGISEHTGANQVGERAGTSLPVHKPGRRCWSVSFLSGIYNLCGSCRCRIPWPGRTASRQMRSLAVTITGVLEKVFDWQQRRCRRRPLSCPIYSGGRGDRCRWPEASTVVVGDGDLGEISASVQHWEPLAAVGDGRAGPGRDRVCCTIQRVYIAERVQAVPVKPDAGYRWHCPTEKQRMPPSWGAQANKSVERSLRCRAGKRPADLGLNNFLAVCAAAGGSTCCIISEAVILFWRAVPPCRNQRYPLAGEEDVFV